MNTPRRFLYACAVGLVFSSCGTTRNSFLSETHLSDDYCAPADAARYGKAEYTLYDTDSLLYGEGVLQSRLSAHGLLMANATGTFSWLERWLSAQNDSSLEGRVKALELNARIRQRILLVRIQIDGIAAELDCQGERTDQLAHYLDKINNARGTRLTVASIVVGAVTTVATVLIKNGAAQNGVAIGGGLLSAGLGLFTINPGGKKVSFTHPRNVLRDLWFRPAVSSVYPSGLWYILNERRFSNTGDRAIAENIRQRWTEFELGNKADDKTVEILFGNGGVYTADLLHTRSDMINQLQSAIRLINQDMQAFVSEVENLSPEKY